MGIKSPNKTFSLDGVSSGTFGVYITGEGVFNAPERAVDMIDIPHRNGSFALDQGRFNNVEVTYRAGMVDVSEDDFADRMSDFRNWLLSKQGYVRLTDDYNANEYRMAVYSSGLEVDISELYAGEFDVTFNCKPQRFLTSGETEVAVANNGTIDNPTLFDAEPLLAVKGYGNLTFNGFSIDIENVVIGDIFIADSGESQDVPLSYTIGQGIANNGDTIDYSIQFSSIIKYQNMGESVTGTTTPTCTNASFQASIDWNQLTTITSGQFNIGTSATVSNSVTGSLTWKKSGVTWTTAYTVTQSIQYDSAARTITISMTGNYVDSRTGETYDVRGKTIQSINIVCHSTVSALGNPTYIDCEIGECYMIKNGNIVTLNGVISLGSELPKLAHGTNTFVYDNTITELKVTPRFWKV